MGLPKAYRLKERRDFQAVYQNGIRLDSPHLTVRALKVMRADLDLPTTAQVVEGNSTTLSSLSPPQIGISISQKVSRLAVQRNRLKRQIRAAMRQLLPMLAPGWKIIIVVRPTAIECNYEHFLRELKELLSNTEMMIHGS